jgi:hypothetical protein
VRPNRAGQTVPVTLCRRGVDHVVGVATYFGANWPICVLLFTRARVCCAPPSRIPLLANTGLLRNVEHAAARGGNNPVGDAVGQLAKSGGLPGVNRHA